MSDVPIANPSEVRVLLAYLQRVRDAVVASTDGLGDEVRRAGVPSGTNLLGLIHHLTGVEQHWIQSVFLGDGRTADKGMEAPHGRSTVEVIAEYRRVCARNDEIVRVHPDLSTPAAVPNPGESQRDSLRVILTHLVEETARHAGHADILRELIDGTTND